GTSDDRIHFSSAPTLTRRGLVGMVSPPPRGPRAHTARVPRRVSSDILTPPAGPPDWRPRVAPPRPTPAGRPETRGAPRYRRAGGPCSVRGPSRRGCAGRQGRGDGTARWASGHRSRPWPAGSVRRPQPVPKVHG